MSTVAGGGVVTAAVVGGGAIFLGLTVKWLVRYLRISMVIYWKLSFVGLR
jgi:hypothetical protein